MATALIVKKISFELNGKTITAFVDRTYVQKGIICFLLQNKKYHNLIIEANRITSGVRVLKYEEKDVS